MLRIIWQSCMTYVVLGLLVCVVYPLVMTEVAAGLFPYSAKGSFVEKNGVAVGSSLLGQNFTSPHYFWGRPSAAGTGYDPMASGASNLGPTSPVLNERVEKTVHHLITTQPGLRMGDVPVDLVTTSGSGLDPHISPAAAHIQAQRVATARHIPLEAVQTLIDRYTKGPQWGVFGENTVNVLLLNLELDRLNGH